MWIVSAPSTLTLQWLCISAYLQLCYKQHCILRIVCPCSNCFYRYYWKKILNISTSLFEFDKIVILYAFFQNSKSQTTIVWKYCDGKALAINHYLNLLKLLWRKRFKWLASFKSQFMIRENISDTNYIFQTITINTTQYTHVVLVLAKLWNICICFIFEYASILLPVYDLDHKMPDACDLFWWKNHGATDNGVVYVWGKIYIEWRS